LHEKERREERQSIIVFRQEQEEFEENVFLRQEVRGRGGREGNSGVTSPLHEKWKRGGGEKRE